MADRNVTLNYGEQGVVPDQDPIRVRKGHSISFKLGKGAPPKAKVRITFQDASSFSKPHFDEGDPDIKVVESLAKPTTYECDLVVDGKVQPRPKGTRGGGVLPD